MRKQIYFYLKKIIRNKKIIFFLKLEKTNKLSSKKRNNSLRLCNFAALK